MTAIGRSDFDFVCALAYKHAAIVLETGKEYLVESRLAAVARQTGCSGLPELVSQLRTRPFGNLHQLVIEALTTNETSFFRDLHPFDALRKTILPELIARRSAEQKLTIWCGAASTGQEPYSIALLLREHFPQLQTWNVRILACDINREVLEKARRGCYTQIEVNRGLPAPLLVRYFEKAGTEWQLKEPIRRMVEFKELNLIAPWPIFPPADIVFLRNVLIYFDLNAKKSILLKVRRLLRPDGVLFLGGAETPRGVDEQFERIALEKSSCYRVSAG
jgi:chemotaxis protein methyltransferase CheR